MNRSVEVWFAKTSERKTRPSPKRPSARATRFVPLSQRIALMLGDEHPGSPIVHADVPAEWVRGVNLNVTANRERFVIASSDALLRSLVKATAVDSSDAPKRFQVM